MPAPRPQPTLHKLLIVLLLPPLPVPFPFLPIRHHLEQETKNEEGETEDVGPVRADGEGDGEFGSDVVDAGLGEGGAGEGVEGKDGELG